MIRSLVVLGGSVLGAALSACAASQSVVPPVRLAADSATPPGPMSVAGCATLELRVHVDGRVVSDTSHRADCGPAVPQLVGTPTFDQHSRQLTLALAIRNTGPLNLHAPSAISITRDSVRVNAHSARALGIGVTDPARGDDTRLHARQVTLSFDSLLRPVAPVTSMSAPRSLQAGHLSAPREIVLAIPPGDTMVHMALRARGRYVYTVAPSAPSLTPDSVGADAHLPANVITDDSLIAGRVTRNRFYIRFKPEATLEERQAVIDAIDGVVAGGYHLGTLQYYFVYLPWAVGHDGRALDSALRIAWTYKQIARLRQSTLELPVFPGGPSRDTASLLDEPLVAVVGGRRLSASAHPWRNFMPSPGTTPDGSPLSVALTVITADSTTFPEDVTADSAWVVVDGRVWASIAREEVPHQRGSDRRYLVMRNGPNWGPGVMATVVVQLRAGNGDPTYLRAPGQMIAGAH